MRDELIQSLRACAEESFTVAECHNRCMFNDDQRVAGCVRKLLLEAADALEHADEKSDFYRQAFQAERTRRFEDAKEYQKQFTETFGKVLEMGGVIYKVVKEAGLNE